jgi:hypothetical protein
MSGVKEITLPGKYLVLGAVNVNFATSVNQEALSTKLMVYQPKQNFDDPYTGSTFIKEVGSFPEKLDTIQYTPSSPSVDIYVTKRASTTLARRYPLFFSNVVDLDEGDVTVGLFGHAYSSTFFCHYYFKWSYCSYTIRWVARLLLYLTQLDI